MVRIVSDRQKATVDFRVEGFHPTVHDFRKPGDGGNGGGFEARILKSFESTAG